MIVFSRSLRRKWFFRIALGLLLAFALFLLYKWSAVVEYYVAEVAGMHGDNSLQKSRSRSLFDLINSQNVGSNLLPKKISLLPSYSAACKYSKPKILHENCLFWVVEGKTNQEATQLSINTSELIRRVDLIGDGLGLDFAYVVILPVTRNVTYEGEITPYSLSKYFVTEEPLLLKIGK